MDQIRDESKSSGAESLIDALHSPSVVSNLINVNQGASRQRQNSTSSEAEASSSTSNNQDSEESNGYTGGASAGINVESTELLVPKEQERKELILYLLAQVCALHDSTPKTFIVHVLSLYESGILDDESIRLLINHGLVPPSSPSSPTGGVGSPTTRPNATKMNKETNQNLQVEYVEEGEGDNTIQDEMINEKTEKPQVEYVEEEANMIQDETALTCSIIATQMTMSGLSSSSQQIIPQQTQMTKQFIGPDTQEQSRAQKVYAIRQHLEHHEAMNNWKNFDGAGLSHPSHHSSWSVEHHPLSFSRYNRDFIQKSLLASGSFGQVFHALNKLDDCDYAVKRVAFSAKGYDTKQVDMVIREVQCLAQLGHENVVRYFTSWLEPTWTPGSAEVDVEDSDDESLDSSPDIKNRMLKNSPEADYDDIQSAEASLLNKTELQRHEGLSAWSFRNSNDGQDTEWNQLASHQSDAFDSNSISTGGYGGGSNESGCSEWTMNQSTQRHSVGNYNASSKFSCTQQNSTARNSSRQSQKKQDKAYKYQICLFIQMQLCRPATLADWIRNRNNAELPKSLSKQHKRYLAAATIFLQISRGLAHVHSRGIVHRDLKPANIFHSAEDDCFKIGDFGLSKMLLSANAGKGFDQEEYSIPHNTAIVPLYNGDWQDPLTAGVGTSSYAAPEQLSSKSYGSEADIFSLGLILLELFSNFVSAHERAITFQNCRLRGVLPDWLASSSPLKDVGDLILSCTQPNAGDRPTASDIVQRDLFSDSKVADMQETVIRNLELQLQKKEEENERLRLIIEQQAEELRIAASNGSASSSTGEANDVSDEDSDY